MTAFIPNVDLTVIKRLFGAVEQPGGFIVNDVISPVIEIQDLALMQRRESLTVFGNLTTTGTQVTVQVNDDQIWLVHLIGTETDGLDADQSVTMQLMINLPGALSFTRFRFEEPVSVTSLFEGGVGKIFPKPLILPSGSVVGVTANEVAAGASGIIATALNLQITRIPT